MIPNRSIKHFIRVLLLGFCCLSKSVFILIIRGISKTFIFLTTRMLWFSVDHQIFFLGAILSIRKSRERGRETETETGRQRERQTERERERKRETERETERDRERQRERQRD